MKPAAEEAREFFGCESFGFHPEAAPDAGPMVHHSRRCGEFAITEPFLNADGCGRLLALLTAVASEAVAGEMQKVRVMAIALADDSDDAPGGMVCCLCGDGREFGDDEEAATANIGTCPHSENCPLRTGSPS